MTGDLRPPSRQAAMLEALTAFEPARLALNGVKLARQPRGDGRSVYVLPGFGAGDASTAPLRAYLRSLNYDARGWGLGTNTGDVDTVVHVLIPAIERRVDRSSRRVPLVGWSLGGVIAREIARERPHLVEQVITFGSPIVGGPKYTRVGEVYRQRGVDLDEIARIVDQRNHERPLQVPVTAIYTKGDGVVSWRACVDTITPGARNVEVRTTHLGLGLHHRVYEEVAQQLATHGRRRT